MERKRRVTISAIAIRYGWLWLPQVRVNDVNVYTGEHYVSYSKALRDARDHAIAYRLEYMR